MDHQRLTAEEFSALVTAVTSAFGDPTRRQIYLFAQEHDGATASEVAAHFALHPNVARHHLDKLAAGGYLDVHTDRVEGGGAGRPSKRYVPSGQDATPELPLRRDDMLVALLGRALRLIPADAAEVMAEEVGVEYGQAMVSSLGSGEARRSLRAALGVVADALTAHGFAAHAEGTGSALTIVSEHCPYGPLVHESPVICAVHRGMVKGMLASLYGETDPETVSSLPLGDSICVTAL